jgi:hypothetical protein
LSQAPSPFCFGYGEKESHIYAWTSILLFILPK